jgi:hypothetical protein
LRGIADESRFDRVTQADSLGVDIDLHRLRLSGRGVEFDIGERAAGNHQTVAALERLLGGLGSEEADAADREGTVVRNRAFAEQRFGRGRCDPLGERDEFTRGAKPAAAG